MGCCALLTPTDGDRTCCVGRWIAEDAEGHRGHDWWAEGGARGGDMLGELVRGAGGESLIYIC